VLNKENWTLNFCSAVYNHNYVCGVIPLLILSYKHASHLTICELYNRKVQYRLVSVCVTQLDCITTRWIPESVFQNQNVHRQQIKKAVFFITNSHTGTVWVKIAAYKRLETSTQISIVMFTEVCFHCSGSFKGAIFSDEIEPLSLRNSLE